MKQIKINPAVKAMGTPRRSIVALSLMIAVALAGCGGGGSKGTSATVSDPTGSNGDGVQTTYGEFTTRVVGAAQPPVVSTAAKSAVTGIAGASFTTIYQNRSAESLSLNNTRIAYSGYDDNGMTQIYTVSPIGGVPTQITSGPGGRYTPFWQPAGTRIAYLVPDSVGNLQIFTIAATGGTPTQITKGGNDKTIAGYSPDGSKIFYGSVANNVRQIFSIPATGGTPTQVTTDNTNKIDPVLSPDGTKVAFRARDVRGYYQIFVLSLAGGSVNEVTFEQYDATEPAWSPDGSRIAYETYDANFHLQVKLVSSNGGTGTSVTNVGTGAFHPGWSPDGTQLTCSILDDQNEPQVAFVSVYGGDPTFLTAGNRYTASPVWSPYLNFPVTLIGSGGLLGTGAAGFLYATDGSSIRSVLAFDTAAATTDSRGAARVLNLTPPSAVSPSLIFSITAADSLSKVVYTNYNTAGQPGKPVNVYLGTGITGALVHFNAQTSMVAAVLPYTANRSVGASAPTVRHEGNAFVVTGNFTGAFDATGANQAAHGAHTIRLDAATGKLLSAE